MAAWTVAMLSLGSSPALAASARPLITSFGSLSNPQGIAINQANGDVYVADSGNNRIQEFSSSGTFIAAFGAGVDQTTSANVCTALSGDTCGPGTAGSSPGSFETAEFVAVDNSAGASTGDVYVGDTGDSRVSKFDANGNLISTWGTGGQVAGSPSSSFAANGGIAGVTVDSNGNLMVFENRFGGDVDEFSQAGSFVGATATARGAAPNGLASNAAGDFFKVNADGSVEELTSAGSDIGVVTADTGSSTPVSNAIAIEPMTGDLYTVTAGRTIDHYAFNGSGDVVEPGSSPCAVVPSVGCSPSDSVPIGFGGGGVAVNSATGDTYVSNPSSGQVSQFGALITVPDVTTGSATAVGATAATLNGIVNPDGIQVTDCHFEYIPDSQYSPSAPDPYAGGGSAACTQTVGAGTSPVSVSVRASGLQNGVLYDYRLDASNAGGSNTGQNQQFTTVAPPAIDSASAQNLTSSAADLTARINSGNGDTTYRFEYGTSTGYGTSVPVPDADIGSGASDAAVTQHIMGLTQNTTYHWRVIATNVAGTTTSPDHTFIYDTTSAGLPDNRAYELVSPVQKDGAELDGGVGTLNIPPQVGPDGSSVISTDIQCLPGAPSCDPARFGATADPFEFSRTPAGWTTVQLVPPALTFGNDHTVRTVDPAASTAVFSVPRAPNGPDDFVARRSDGSFADIGPVGQALDSFKGVGTTLSTADLSQVIYASNIGSLWSFDATSTAAAGIGAVYDYAGTGNSAPLMVGVSGGLGSTDLISTCGTSLGGPGVLPPSALSADGRTVFFTAQPCPSGSGANAGTPVPAELLYARVAGTLPGAHTVAISQRSSADCTTSACQGSTPGDAAFEGASTDGSKAYFASTQQLTDAASEDSTSGDSATTGGCDQTTGANGCNLYLYDFARPPAHELIDVAAGDTSGGGPRVQGVTAISADGSHVYFVAKGVLTSSANAQGQTATDGAQNLYVYDATTGHTAFVAAPPSNFLIPIQFAHADVTPDGRFLVFESAAQLTPDDTNASGARQVFRYDAQTGALTRISIGSGGLNDNGNGGNGALASAGIVAPSVPDASFGVPARTDPTMSDDGTRVFFTSPVGLTPRALDQVPVDSSGDLANNVYEWEQAGAGSCPAGRASGCVYLISDGHDTSDLGITGGGPGGTDMQLLGSDTTGDNVFFETSSQLVPEDTDTGRDVYDARVGGGFPFTPPSAPCSGDSCQGTPSGAPAVPTAATVSFTGPGNASPTAATPRVRMLTRVVHDSTFLVSVSVPGLGRVAITGNGIRTASTWAPRAGTYRLRVTLTAKEARALRRRHGVELGLRIAYAPAAGQASVASVSIAVRSVRGRRARTATARRANATGRAAK